MSLKQPNYPILKANYDKFVNAKKSKNIRNKHKINDFYVSEFETKVNTVSNTEQGKINLKMIEESKKNEHSKIMAKIYIIPLAFLIYSYIYVKYYNQQIIVENRSENKLNFEIFTKFFFSHENPVIKKVNVFFHKKYKELDEKNNNGANNNNVNNSDLVNNIKSSKKETIDFLKFIIVQIKEEHNYDKLIENLENIIENFNSCIEDIYKITYLLQKIKSNIGNINNYSSYITKVEQKIKSRNINKFKNFTNLNFTRLVTSLKDEFLKIKKFSEENFTEFKKYEVEYKKIIGVYKNLLKKIHNNNINILDLKFKDNGKYNDFQEISEDDININNFIEIYKKYYEVFTSIKTEKDKEDAKIKAVNELIENFSNQLEIYDEIYDIKNNNNFKNKKIEKYLKEFFKLIKSIYINIDNYYGNTSIENILKNSITTTNTNDSLEDLIKRFLLSILINIKVEEYYIKLKYNNKNNNENNNENNNDTIINYILKIKENKLLFNEYFRAFKKSNGNIFKDYLEYLKKIDKDVIIKKDYININLESSKNTDNITNNNNTLGKINNELTQIDTDIGKKKNEFDEVEKIFKNMQVIKTEKDNVDINQGSQLYNFIRNKASTSKNIPAPVRITHKNNFANKENAIKLYKSYETNALAGIKIIPIKDEVYKKITDIIGQGHINKFKDIEIKYLDENKSKKDLYQKKILLEQIDDVYDYYLKKKIDIENQFSELKNKKDNKITEKNQLELKIFFKNTNREILAQKNKDITEIKSKIDSIKSNIDKAGAIADSTSDLKIQFNKNFDIIISLVEKYNENIDKINYNRANNKVYYLYEHNERDFINMANDIINIKYNSINNSNIEKFIHNILKSYPTNFLKNIISNIKNNKNLSTIKQFLKDSYNAFIKTKKYIKPTTNNNTIIKFLKDSKFKKIIIEYIKNHQNINYNLLSNHLSTYFAENPNNFIERLFDEIKENNKTVINPFLEQFKKYNDKLKDKINFYLDKIIKEELQLKVIDEKSIETFNKVISKKKAKIEKIQEHIDNINNEKRGKFTIIIPYTDTLLIYFLHMLIIVDYLTFFYE